MFSIFRKLRLKLIFEGKLQRYLYYAIGEISLIVIGILIAVQINNWNESKKDHHRLMSTLESLNEELTLNQSRFLDSRESHTLFLNASEVLFNAHLNGESTNESSNAVMNAFRFATFYPALSYSNTAYSELLTNNMLEHVSSAELKALLVKYYENIGWLDSRYSGINSSMNAIINDIYHYTIITPGGAEHTMSRKAGTAGEDNFTIVYDLEAFRADKSMNGKLFDMIDWHKDRIGMLEGLDALTQKIMPKLRKERGSE